MKPHTSSFSRHLIGGNRLRRPAFFKAYVIFWIHVSIGLALRFYFSHIETDYYFALVIIGSCAFSLAVYGAITHQPKYYLNIFSYLLIAGEVWNGPELGRPFSIAALILVTTSFYFFIKEQITTFLRPNFTNTSFISKNWPSIAFFCLVAVIAAILIRFKTVI
ncbi:MAG: hypothetical protein VX294_04480 [Candidatus Latescibacterota bacterium]|nr:hypothetical protein [Candidatus Latescibacterota bacterium]